MLKARAGETLIFGLSATNIAKLKLGQPIKFNLATMGLEPRDVIIFYGEDEMKMKKDLEPMIGPNTKIIDDSFKQYQ